MLLSCHFNDYFRYKIKSAALIGLHCMLVSYTICPVKPTSQWHSHVPKVSFGGEGGFWYPVTSLQDKGSHVTDPATSPVPLTLSYVSEPCSLQAVLPPESSRLDAALSHVRKSWCSQSFFYPLFPNSSSGRQPTAAAACACVLLLCVYAHIIWSVSVYCSVFWSVKVSRTKMMFSQQNKKKCVPKLYMRQN